MDEDDLTAPAPPADAPKYLVEGLGKQNAGTLRAVARYADRLADHREAEATAELEADAVDVADTPDGWDDGEALRGQELDRQRLGTH